MKASASQLNGVREAAGQWLDRQVRMGAPAHVSGMPESARSPGFAVCAGPSNYALVPAGIMIFPKPRREEVRSAQVGCGRRMGRWIADSS